MLWKLFNPLHRMVLSDNAYQSFFSIYISREMAHICSLLVSYSSNLLTNVLPVWALLYSVRLEITFLILSIFHTYTLINTTTTSNIQNIHLVQSGPIAGHHHPYRRQPSQHKRSYGIHMVSYGSIYGWIQDRQGSWCSMHYARWDVIKI